MKEVRAVPREWQLFAQAKEIDYLKNGGFRPLLAGCPASGKTLYAVMSACSFFNTNGGQLIVVIAPTVNIKIGWIKEFRSHGFKTTGDIKNSLIQDRLDNGEDIKSDYEVIVATYYQLAKSDGLFAHYADRYKTMVIADEVHHADDQAEFGSSLTLLADKAARRLALSGTPFNTQGGALAMCDCERGVDEYGKPIMKTVPFYSYSYGEALNDKVCRVIEFGIIYGKATTTYESLLNGKTFQRVTEGKKETDSLRPFLDLEGDFLPTMLDEALAKLDDMKLSDRRAAMLIVAQDVKAAADIESWLREKCNYSLQVIVHDTEKAHDRIERLPKDNTDIVISVRMISEGIDVKRFRIGVFASDYTTQLFFIQFVGRFIRWDSNLSDEQYAKLLFPGHIKLVKYASKIEEMILESIMAPKNDTKGGDDGSPDPPSSIKIGTESEATDQQTMARGSTLNTDDQNLVNSWRKQNPMSSSNYADHVIAGILKGDQGTRQKWYEEANATNQQRDLRDKNIRIVRAVVNLLRSKWPNAKDKDLYEEVQGKANRAVGIRQVDALTSEEKLIERHDFLRSWVQRLLRNEDLDERGFGSW